MPNPDGTPKVLPIDRWPLDVMTPITNLFAATPEGGSLHMGVDIGVPVGTAIFAPCRLKVIEVFNPDGSFGNALAGDWPDTDYYMLFAHMQAPARYGPGNDIAGGTWIGNVGLTGKTSGPHLHWQVGDNKAWPRELARHIDPLSLKVRGAPPPPPPAGPTNEELLAIIDKLGARLELVEALFGGKDAVAAMAAARGEQ